jgi:multicomponent Na+:H+ antiporter subunit E
MEKRSVLLRYVMAYISLGAIWLLLAGKVDANELIAGMFVTLIIVVLTSSHLKFFDDLKFTPVMPLHLIRFVLVFLRALIEANVDMARRVLSPSLPIYPAVVEVHTELKSPLGKLLLANSITLTPGTLTIDVVGDTLLVHWIDASGLTDMQQATRLIAQQFEKHLAGVVR